MSLDPSPSPSPPPHHPRPRRTGLLGGVGVLGLAILAKGKSLLLVVKGLKFAKLFVTMGSMVTMVWFEAVRYGWAFGVGFVVLLLIHELGHAVAMKRAGLETGYPVFIPFFGALISGRGQLRSSIVDAQIALAGPIAGTAASVACAGIYLATGSRLWLALAHSGFFLNLFNMVPFGFLDGGRAARVFSRTAWIVGAILLVAIFAMTQAPQLLVIGLFGAFHMFGRGRAPVYAHEAEVTPEARRNVAFNYFGLCGFLGVGLYLTHGMLAR